jgi:branched-chain amino acid transport system ATP-binding protein
VSCRLARPRRIPAPGSIDTVIGANGAGKTTLLNALMGLLPSRGRVTFDGAPLDGYAIEERVALGLALVPERRELFGSMSVADNLLLGGFRRPSAVESYLGRGGMRRGLPLPVHRRPLHALK